MGASGCVSKAKHYAADGWPIIAVCYLMAARASNASIKALGCGALVVPLPDYYKTPADD
jgi:hypothetical protein